MATTVFSSSVVSDGRDPIFTYEASGDNLVVYAGVTLSNKARFIVRAESGLSDLQATINGSLLATQTRNNDGAALFASGSSIDLTVGSTGRLEASRGDAFTASYDSNVTNHGVIRSETATGVSVDAATTSTVENWGAIHGRSGAVTYHDPDNATVVNHGTLQTRWWAAVVFDIDGDATTHLTNTGSILATDVGAGVLVRGSNAPTNPDNITTIDNTGTIRSGLTWGVETYRVSTHLTNEGTISGANGSLMFLYSGADTVTNDGHLDGRVRFGSGDDVYHGENGRVSGAVWGQAGDDLLAGGAHADVFGGGSGNDTLTGGGGADTLTGSAGEDFLSGGAGNDVFRFATAGESRGDTIVASDGTPAFVRAGRAGGDRIDVSAIDADLTNAGKQDFVFGTSQQIGRLWAEDVGNVTHIRGNVSGGPAPEFDLAISDGAGVQASDYAALDFIL